jgi:hypothetical protein
MDMQKFRYCYLMHCVYKSVMYVLSVLSMGYSPGGTGFELLQGQEIFCYLKHPDKL